MSWQFVSSALFLVTVWASVIQAVCPTIQLDYSTILPSAGNSSVGFCKYQNIRYAAIPAGPLRWAKPQWPPTEHQINTGNLAQPNVSCATTEDCLFMDIWIPSNQTGKPLAVMVWQHGGGFNIGSKAQQAATQTTPEGLFGLSSDFIFVSFNYRLGIAGLATGPSFNHQGGISNAGLWDTEHGFRWIQRYIGAFGGDSGRVTAVGHSAGASSVIFMMTRFAGHAEQLFSRAFIQSPGYFAGAGHWSAEQFWLNVSATARCPGGNISCMRAVPFQQLNRAASTATRASGYVMQPKVDGNFVADTYEAQFYQRNFNFSGEFVITHHQHEGNSVPYQGIGTEREFREYLRQVFPCMAEEAMDVMFSLYPVNQYESQALRLSDIAQSMEMTARNLAATHALDNNTWNGQVIIPPATHQTDQPYYWYAPYKLSVVPGIAPSPQEQVHVPTAIIMQKYLLSFVITGDPNKLWPDTEGKIYWPKYNQGNQPQGRAMIFNTTGLSIGPYDLSNERSVFWNKALWY